MADLNRVTYFAETDSRNKRIKFGIKAKDRTRHVYVIGKTGMGKSTLLENMAVQDLKNGEGMAFMDPHGKTAELLLEYVPKNRLKDVLYFAPFDTDYPVSFNVMEDIGPDKRHLVVSGLMSAFKKIWLDAWSARMEYILSNTLLALLEYPGSTLLEVNKMLSDKEFRKEVISHVQDQTVKTFWTKEFANYTERMAAEAVPAIQNKVGQFTANPLVRNLIGQSRSSFDIRKFMDEKKIIIINLSKGKVGEQNANLIGSMLITKIYLAAMSRADVAPAELEAMPNFYFYVDEFQSFANESFANILSEARKYHLNLTIAHQYIEQMSDEVRAAVFGNVGTMISFRVGSYDAEVLEKEFAPTFTSEDLVNLGFAQIYLKLMIDGVGSQPFSGVTLPPIKRDEESHLEEVIALSREQFAFPRAVVEEKLNARQGNDTNTTERKDVQKTEKQNIGSARGRSADSTPSGASPRVDSNKEKQDKPITLVKPVSVPVVAPVVAKPASREIISDKTISAPISRESVTEKVQITVVQKESSQQNQKQVPVVPRKGTLMIGDKKENKQESNDALRKALEGLLKDPRIQKDRENKVEENKKTQITDVRRETSVHGTVNTNNTNTSAPNSVSPKAPESLPSANADRQPVANNGDNVRNNTAHSDVAKRIGSKPVVPQPDMTSSQTKNINIKVEHSTLKEQNFNKSTDSSTIKDNNVLPPKPTDEGLREVPEEVLKKIFKE